MQLTKGSRHRLSSLYACVRSCFVCRVQASGGDKARRVHNDTWSICPCNIVRRRLDRCLPRLCFRQFPFPALSPHCKHGGTSDLLARFSLETDVRAAAREWRNVSPPRRLSGTSCATESREDMSNVYTGRFLRARLCASSNAAGLNWGVNSSWSGIPFFFFVFQACVKGLWVLHFYDDLITMFKFDLQIL